MRIVSLVMGAMLIIGSSLLMAIGYEWSLWGLALIVCAGLGGSLIGLSHFARS